MGIEAAWLENDMVPEAMGNFLLADEISTMLDAITQAQLWRFLLAEVERRNMGLIVVTHNSALASRVCSQVRTISDMY
ncbi:MAG: hypothetical protein LBK00_01395 [Treponema sp.]|jgi:peptide/nickel transport system ATP-binding protein|nr:hypothetical protein [Treponema sp.]